MLSLRSDLGLREFKDVKSDDTLERQSLVFIQYSDNYSGIAKETKRRLGLSRG